MLTNPSDEASPRAGACGRAWHADGAVASLWVVKEVIYLVFVMSNVFVVMLGGAVAILWRSIGLARGGGAAGALAYLLKIGFTPTQVADSFAIAFGGATFYRNRINTYLKQGMTQEQAESQAMIDFQDITEESQQSSRPDRISKQQASPVGRLLLAFQNTPLQYNRIIKKAVSDIANNRGDKKTHISRISYYGAVQAFIFYALQQALFADDEPEEEEVPGSVKREYNAGIKDGSISMVEYPNVGFYYQDVKNKQKKESNKIYNKLTDT